MKSYSLSELLSVVQLALRGAFPNSYWVRAEISSLSAKPSSHCYLELAESESSEDLLQARTANNAQPQFKAKIKANCWRSTWQQVSLAFEHAVGMPLKVGMQVLAEVSVDFHPVYGLSLTIQDIDPSYSLGALAKQKEATLKRLTDEGVIDLQKSLRIPTLPQRLAVISASTAAGYEDFQNQLLHNAAGYAFRTTLFAATMQGDTAAASIISALDAIYSREQEFDAVVIIRGGGATTDLSAFDNYDLAFYCANFPLPIIAGIGHTRDVSVVDRVSFFSVKTPTAAAEYFIQRIAEQDEMLQLLSERLRQTAAFTRTLAAKLDQQQMRIRLLFQQRLQKQIHELDIAEKTIELHSPERIFRMGYSLTTSGGRIIRHAEELKIGQRITTILGSGKVDSIVE